MRVIFMGTPDFAVGTLEEIIRAGHEVVLAVSQPDKAVGRSRELKPTAVKACAMRHGIEVYQPERVREPACVEYLRKYAPDVIIVVAFGQIIPKEILEMPRYCCVNLHASLLPKYRGAAPIQWAILNGDRVTGVTAMRMDEGLDTGDIIFREELEIREDDTAGSLSERLSEAGARLCVKTIDALGAGTALFTPQDPYRVTHTTKIHREMGSIDWTKGAREIECLVRGLNPWPGAYTHLGDKTLKIWRAKAIPGGAAAAPGCIVQAGKDVLAVQAGDGCLKLLEVQLEGKKRMSVEAFQNGYKIKEGMCLKRCYTR